MLGVLIERLYLNTNNNGNRISNNIFDTDPRSPLGKIKNIDTALLGTS